jgi:hypothetical protein
MFPWAVHASVMAKLSFKSRLGLVRRRRRANFLRPLLTALPVLLASSALLLVALGGLASSR